MSVERRDRLVEQIVDTQPRLTIFVRPLPSELLAGSWDLLSYSFQRGFEMMWDQACAETSGLLTRPLLSLWRQSVELALKASILEIAGSLPPKLSHNLRGLFEHLLAERAALGHDDADDLARDVARMIDSSKASIRSPTASATRHRRTGRPSQESQSTWMSCSRPTGLL